MKETIVKLLDIKNSTDISITDDKTWNYIMDFCGYHELYPILYIKWSHQLLPSHKEKIKTSYYLSLARNMLLMEEFLKLKTELDDKGIKFLPLKGIDFLNTIYPEINFRSMADIDILIPEDKIKDCEKILTVLGYQKILGGMSENYWQNYHCHFMYGKNSSGTRFHLELHWALDFKRFRNIDFHHLWIRRNKIKVNGIEISVLSPEDTLIALALHQRRFHNPLILKNIVDSYLIITSYTIDWKYVTLTCYQYRLRSSFNLLLNIIEEVYNLNFDDFRSKLRIKNFVNQLQKKLITRFLYNPELFKNYSVQKRVYFYLYFLIFDSWWELCYYLVFISPEKFAKFFNFSPYSLKNKLTYKLRLLYVPFKFLSLFLRKNLR